MAVPGCQTVRPTCIRADSPCIYYYYCALFLLSPSFSSLPTSSFTILSPALSLSCRTLESTTQKAAPSRGRNEAQRGLSRRDRGQGQERHRKASTTRHRWTWTSGPIPQSTRGDSTTEWENPGFPLSPAFASWQRSLIVHFPLASTLLLPRRAEIRREPPRSVPCLAHAKGHREGSRTRYRAPFARQIGRRSI